MPVRLDPLAEYLSFHSRNRDFARRIDGQDYQGIRPVKRPRKILKQGRRARVPVWLEDNHNTPVRPALSDRVKRGPDLCGVMTIIIHEDDSPNISF